MFHVFRKRSHDRAGSVYSSTAAYHRLLGTLLRKHKDDRALAFAQAVGSVSVALFAQQGDGHVAVLRHHGLTDGMVVFDLGCGCGRTAQALQRSGWQGTYNGTDIVPAFVEELMRQCPTYRASVHTSPTIPMPDAALDWIFHWSVFTHLSPEECFLYLQDSYRALKPGGRTVFSFLELTSPLHQPLFASRCVTVASGAVPTLLDTFLHRDWLRLWASEIGFDEPVFTNGDDDTDHPQFWQTLVAMTKPTPAA